MRQPYIVDAVRGKSVLDIGCVAANRLQELHLQLRQVATSCVGMDISKADGVVHGDAQNFDLGRTFEVIVAGEVIEHLADLRGFLNSAARSLVQGGRLIITTPNPYSLVMLRHAVLSRQVPNDAYHVLLLDSTVLCNLVKNYGQGIFRGELYYYEETGALSLPYRMNRWFSKGFPKFSSGLLLDLEKIDQAPAGSAHRAA